MKILILQDDFPPQSFGGAGFSTFYLACGLQKAGHRVFVITTCREKSDEGVINYQGFNPHTIMRTSFANFFAKGDVSSFGVGVRVFRIFTNYHERWRGYLSLYNPQIVKKVREIIKEIKPDVVHAHNIQSYLSYHCLKIGKQYSRAIFFTARDATAFSYGKLATKKYLEKFDYRTNWWDHLKQARKRYNPLRNFLIKRYLSSVDKIFAVSSALKNALEQNGIRNVEVSYTGINVDDWRVSPEKIKEFKEKYKLLGKRVIFFGGRISGLKGLEQIKQAVSMVKKEIPEVFLLVAGKRGIGWLAGDELRAAYHCADIIAVPSVYLDPLPRSVLEGMACQKPVVGTCYGGTPEVIKNGVTGFIVNPFDIELMAEKIIDLLKNPQKAEQFGEAGFQRVRKHFSLDSQVAQTIAWYQKLT